MEHLLISDAAKKVQVESHVLRYWEEELKLPIKRNEVGHRYYTNLDIERFIQIKTMKERGLQLKAIKMILKDGKLDVLSMEKETEEEVFVDGKENVAIEVVDKKELVVGEESKEEKAQRLQWLLKQLIKETLVENNKELSKEIRESVVKELDYQFRCQDEREMQRNKERDKRDEEYYQRMDELLRKKAGRKHWNRMVNKDEHKSIEEHISLSEKDTTCERNKKKKTISAKQKKTEVGMKGAEKQKSIESKDVNSSSAKKKHQEKPIKAVKRTGRKMFCREVVQDAKQDKLVIFKKKRHLL